jgi:hypothetical protein
MSTKHTKVKTMIDTLRKSDDALTFASLCETAKEKYPQDVQAAMLALVEVGMVEAGKDGRHVTYKWTGGETCGAAFEPGLRCTLPLGHPGLCEAPAPKPRRSRAKKTEVDDAPAAA